MTEQKQGWVLQYAGGDLDRCGVVRKQAEWLERMRVSTSARVVPVWRGHSLLLRDAQGAPLPHLPLASDLPHLLEGAGQWVLLGTRDDVPFFAVAPDAESEAEALALVDDGDFVDLRRVGSLLGGPDASLLAYARGMLHWNETHRFCSRCGAAAASVSGGHVRRCSAEGCGRESYPRTDPAVIMLVTQPATDAHPARCLLGRDQRFPPGVFSTLAGFVEPGESLEEAVAREVREETGVHVANVRYRGSQPWPFPASIMLGFESVATSDEIVIDPDEIAEAHWFSAAEVRTFGSWEDDSARFRLPRRDSIARWLIDAWLEREA